MPLMRSPDGSETVEVPQDQVEHYRQMGAMLVRPAGSRGATAAAPPPPQPDMAQAVMPQGFEPIYSGAPDEPLEAPNFLMDPLEWPAMFFGGRAVPAVAGAGARGVGGLLARGGQKLASTPGLGKVIGKFAAKQVPGLGTALDALEAAGEMGGKAVAKQATKATGKAAAKKAATEVEKKAASKIAGKIKPKATPKPKAAAKPAPKKAEPGGVTTKPQRGQSGPALEQRAKLRAKARAQRQASGDVAAQGGDDLESLLQRSIELEQEMGAMGMSPAQRALGRRVLGQSISGAGGSAAGLAVLAQLLGVHDDQGGY